MTTPKDKGKDSKSTPPLVVVIVMALIGIAVLETIRTGSADKYLVGGLVVLALALAGYGGDRLLERLVDRWSRK